MFHAATGIGEKASKKTINIGGKNKEEIRQPEYK